MNDFNEIQDIWRTAINVDKTTSRNSSPDSVIQKLKKLESLQSRMNKIKMLVLVFLFVLIGYNISSLPEISYPVYLGFGIVFIAVLCFMAFYLKNQFQVKRLDFTKDSLAFTESALGMLKRQNSIFKAPFRIFTLVLMSGTNIMLLGVELNSHDRFFLHANLSFMIAVSALIGMQIRNWRTKKEVDPLIAELNAFKETLDQD